MLLYKMSVLAEKVMVCSRKLIKLGQILLNLKKILASVTAKPVQPLALSLYDGCTELCSLLS